MGPKKKGPKKHASIHPQQSREREKPAWELGSRYDFVKEVGNGSCGIVCEAFDSRDQRAVAIKKIPQVFRTPRYATISYREMRLLRHLQHPNIVKLLNAFATNMNDEERPAPSSLTDLYLVFEFMNCNLAELIAHNEKIDLNTISHMFYQLLDGVAYLHRTNVIHRDIKPQNVLVSQGPTIKIADFGLARVVGEDAIARSVVHESGSSIPIGDEGTELDLGQDQDLPPGPTRLRGHLTKHVVTRPYRAPEVILLQPYSTAVDIWSVGCIFGELLQVKEGRKGILFPGQSCGELSPADDRKHADRAYTQQELQESYANNRGQLKVIFDIIGTPTEEDLSCVDSLTAEMLRVIEKKDGNGLNDRFSFVESPPAVDLLSSMLCFNPRRRISAAQALEHAFFDEIKRFLVVGGQSREVPLLVEEEIIDESIEKLEANIKNEVMNYRRAGK